MAQEKMISEIQNKIHVHLNQLSPYRSYQFDENYDLIQHIRYLK